MPEPEISTMNTVKKFTGKEVFILSFNNIFPSLYLLYFLKYFFTFLDSNNHYFPPPDFCATITAVTKNPVRRFKRNEEQIYKMLLV